MDARSRGFRIHYDATGDGPAVLLVPGIFMSAARWQQTGYVADLARDHRVVAVDPLGHGMSDKPTDPDAYVDEAVVEDLVAVLDAEGIGRAHYWGYSRGAHHGYMLAIARPERLLSLTVGGYSTARPAEWREVMATHAETLRRGDRDGVLAALGVFDEASRAILRRNDAGAMAAALAAEAMSHSPDPKRVSAPTLVYMGSKEPDVEAARGDARLMRGQFLLVEGRGHSEAFQAPEMVLPEFRRHSGSAEE